VTAAAPIALNPNPVFIAFAFHLPGAITITPLYHSIALSLPSQKTASLKLAAFSR
jgi:hypothetical protein